MEKCCDKSGIQENMIVLREIQSVPSVPMLLEHVERRME